MTESEPSAFAVQDDGRSTRRGRLMGKLFGRDRERKATHDDGDLNDFLHGSSDKLQVAHAGPPVLTKLDTRTATRYPNANDVDGAGDAKVQAYVHEYVVQPRKPARKPKKGLAVRFVDSYPEIIGEGGDECEIPTVEVSKRKKLRSPPIPASTAPARPLVDAQASGPSPTLGLRRTQTGLLSGRGVAESGPPTEAAGAGRYLGTPTLSQDERRKSFIEMQQAQMREAEGRAFANAVRAASGDQSSRRQRDSPPLSPDRDPDSPVTPSPDSMHAPRPQEPADPGQAPPIPPRGAQRPRLPAVPSPPSDSSDPSSSQNSYALTGQLSTSPERVKRPQKVESSPSTLYSAASSNFQHPFASSRQGSRISEKDYASPVNAQQTPSSLHDIVLAVSDDAMNAFVTRTRHLFELFRLHAESVRPLISSTPHDFARAALWWFLTGRTALEMAIRERPSTPEAQQKNEMTKQQAYADLAKAYWLLEEALPEVVGSGRTPVDQEVEGVRTTLISSLRKLAVSMKRNGFLPPEEAFLPQTVDRSIWLEYPPLSQDITALLCGSNSALAQSHASSGMSILDSLPLGDSATTFCFARFLVDVFLMEQGRESQRLYMPCFLSTVRPQSQPDMAFVIASQNGAVQLRISGSKNAGPVWEDVAWRTANCALEVKLPRGFLLVVQCSQHAYTTLRSMYEFSAKVHSTLYPRQDEACVFRSTLRAFQYFDNDPQARQFPRESTPNCEIALFERLLREGAATGPRTYHRGYRIAVVTGPRTKTLSGVNQTYSPQTPIQFGFLRSEANLPALSLKFENGRFKGNMVLSFADEKERSRMHSLLIATALDRGESIAGEAALQALWFSERFGDSRDTGLQTLSTLAWNKVRVINYDNDGDRPSCVLADKLRVVYEFKDGTLTDRINVAPGELKLRLDVQNPSCIMVFRQPQADLTLAVTETKASRELSGGLAQALEYLQRSPTIRTFKFPGLAELHAFETAITGFRVLFDGVASAFAISRRRMVVPIHKKWEAGATRVQVVQQPDGAAQLLAFFEDFSHGRCMGFHLKGTDVFESFSRGGKAGLKIDDAKFPLPRVLPPEADGAQEAADAAFLCLDLPELPGEHDDISILFDTEAERDKLTACLPAPVKGSRLPKIKGIT